VLLLDDVSSELDRARTAALLSALQDQVGQVVLTTTRPELIAGAELADRATAGHGDFAPVRFEVRDGQIQRL
jgi:recombinational DNA repair ATPase RecF